MSSQAEIILDLKKQAVALKEAGDTNGAMALLAQARDLEFENISVDDLTEPLKLKQLAVVLKKKGDIEGAKHALLKAKQIEKGGDAVQQLESAAPAPEPEPPEQEKEPEESPDPQQETEKNKKSTSSSQEEIHKADEPDNPPEKAQDEDPPEKAQDEEMISEQDDGDVDPEEEKEMLSKLQVQSDGRIFTAEDNEELDRLMNEQAFTVEEMADHEMMTEFKLDGMPVPSDEDYQTKILECKKSALAFKKAGDTAKAMQELKTSKQLEQVRMALEQMNEGLGLRINDDQDAWIESLTDEESQLLGMTLTKKSSVGEDGGDKKDTLLNILDELADFMEDPNMLMDAIDMGMHVPEVKEIQEEAQRQRQNAVDFKQVGDLESAKRALAQSKKLAAQGAQLEKALAQMRKKVGGTNVDGEGGQQMTLEDLEAMVEAEEKKKHNSNASKETEEKEGTPKPKSSQELRAEAIKLRDAKKVKEATEVLKLYKEALKREEQEAEMQQRLDFIEDINNEIKFANQQIRVHEFYKRFVEPGSQQTILWKEYIDKCTKASNIVEGRGVQALQVARSNKTGLMYAKTREDESFNDMMTNLVEKAGNTDHTDERLEIAVLNVRGVKENSNLEKLLKHQKRDNTPKYPFSIRVHMAVQLPPNEQETDKPTELEFESSTINPNESNDESGGETKQNIPDCYHFDESQYVNLPRGTNDSYAKILRRRIERNKKIQISVYHVPKPMKKGGWLKSFVKSSKDEELPAPTLLGKATVEMQAILTRRCLLIGELHLMNGSGTKTLGGTLSLCVRTGVPFATEATEPQNNLKNDEGDSSTSSAELLPYDVMTFALKQQPGEQTTTESAQP